MNYTSHNARGETLKGRQLEDVDFTSDTVFLGVDAVLTSLLPSLLPSLHLLNIPLITLTLSPTPPPLLCAAVHFLFLHYPLPVPYPLVTPHYSSSMEYLASSYSALYGRHHLHLASAEEEELQSIWDRCFG